MVRFLVVYETPTDPAAFDEHYRQVHIPLAKKLPGLRRYTVSRDVAALRGEPFYLVAELDWDDMDALRAAFASPEGQATARDIAELVPDGGIRSMIFELNDA
ncbi:MAG: EthD family reductase [Actinobacteria bacterium]|nr:MAG: EthD family reductase [Actinomycetota bacterium]